MYLNGSNTGATGVILCGSDGIFIVSSSARWMDWGLVQITKILGEAKKFEFRPFGTKRADEKSA